MSKLDVYTEQCYFYLQAHTLRPKSMPSDSDGSQEIVLARAKKLAKKYMSHLENHPNTCLCKWLDRELT